jgi:catechol 2,3-dioxygenase-like lactoylglutathione lyase family enzyme
LPASNRGCSESRDWAACTLTRVARIERVGNIFYRTLDMDAAVRFYTEVLGFGLKLRDGNRWAAFDAGGTTLAIEGGSPGGPGGATVSLRVEDLAALVDQLRAKGADIGRIEEGPHERKAQLHDPSGNLLILYEPL